MSEIGSSGVEDSVELRARVRAFEHADRRLEQLAEVVAEVPGAVGGTGEAVDGLSFAAGVRAAGAAVRRLGREAEGELRATARSGAGRVVVADPAAVLADHQPHSRHEQDWLRPVLSRPTNATDGLSSAVVSLAPGAAVPPCRWDHAVLVVVLLGWFRLGRWDDGPEVRWSALRRYAHAMVPSGTAHCLANVGPVPAVAVLVAAASDVTAGGEELPELFRGGEAVHAAG